VIVPGKSVDSRLIRKLVDGDGGDQMPPDIELSREEIGLLRAWIDQGADFRNEVAAEPPAKPIDPALAELITAVRSESRTVVERLLTASPALLNAKDSAGSTPLHHAAGFGRLDTLKMLVDAGAEVNAVNPPRLDAAALGNPRRGQGAPVAEARCRGECQAGRGPHAAVSGRHARGTATPRFACCSSTEPTPTSRCKRPHSAHGRCHRGDVEALRISSGKGQGRPAEAQGRHP
jgi:hypothetical protein